MGQTRQPACFKRALAKATKAVLKLLQGSQKGKDRKGDKMQRPRPVPSDETAQVSPPNRTVPEWARAIFGFNEAELEANYFI